MNIHFFFFLKSKTLWKEHTSCNTDTCRQIKMYASGLTGRLIFFPHRAEKTEQVSSNLVTNDKYNAQNQLILFYCWNIKLGYQ